MRIFVYYVYIYLLGAIKANVMIVNGSDGGAITNRILYGCEGTTVTLSCAHDNDRRRRANSTECNCYSGNQDPINLNNYITSVTATGIEKRCVLDTKFKPSCMTVNLTYRKNKTLQIFECSQYRRGEKRSSVQLSLISTCGPKKFVINGHETIIAQLGQTSFKYLCRIPEGSEEDFLYRWFKGNEKREPLSEGFKADRSLTIDIIQIDSTEYTCVIKNKYTNQRVEFIMLLIADSSKNQKSILWISLPAALLVVTIPLIYIAYLRSIGEFDCEFRNLFNKKSNNVDFVFSQSELSKENKPTKRVSNALRNAAMRVSQAIDSISFGNTGGSIAVSLPRTTSDNQSQVAQTYRINRADLLQSVKINPLFKKPLRQIKRQGCKKNIDADGNLVNNSFTKVEQWKYRTSDNVMSEHSHGTVEDMLKQRNAWLIWSTQFITKAGRLTQDGTSTREQWLEVHRAKSESFKSMNPKQFDQSDIAELSDRVTEMYLIAKPHKTYFPTVKRIGDPFHAILCDPSHPSHYLTTVMWNEFMDRMFTVAVDVSSFNKLCRKVLERTLCLYGNPEKISRISRR